MKGTDGKYTEFVLMLLKVDNDCSVSGFEVNNNLITRNAFPLQLEERVQQDRATSLLVPAAATNQTKQC